MVGWCNTCSAIVRHAGVDVWVLAPQTCAFDYGTAIPKHRLYQVRNVPGVAWAEALTMSWNIWQRPDGRRVNVELVGLDDGCVGGPWAMRQGDVDVVHRPDTVIVDERKKGPGADYCHEPGEKRRHRDAALFGCR
jgi:putative ABC transport system permease protein